MTWWKKPFLPIVSQLGRNKEAQHFSKDPVLIGGCGRSGTTLLLSILSASRELFAIPKELGMFNRVVKGKDGRRHPARPDRLYFQLLSHRIPGTANRWCEKSPSNVQQIAAIDEHFHGRFRFLHIIRDGRDVVLSKHPTAPDQYWVEPKRWVNDVSAGLQYDDHPRVHTLFYEDLIRNFSETMEGITQFLKIPFDERLKNWHRFATVRTNAAYFSKVEEIHTKSVRKWKRTDDPARVRSFLKYPGTAQLLRQCNYPEVDFKKS